MGLSASQARLLSITKRINNNELESEMISNAKMRLSTKSTVANEKYINALDSTKLDYVSYDDNGIQDRISLTFNAINQYTPLKNQYALFNTSGQMYVNPKDANNFKDSANLYEFLDKYGLFNEGKNEFQELVNIYNQEMQDYNLKKAEYENKLAEYNRDFANYTAALEEYNRKLEEYLQKQQDYNTQYEEWLEAQNQSDLYAIFSGAVGKSDELLAIPSTSEHLPAGLESSKGCYWSALHPDGTSNRASCYTHVLGHLIDYNSSSDTGGTAGPYISSAGDTVNCAGYSNGYMDNTCNDAMGQVSAGINELDDEGNYKRLCDGTDDYRGITGVTNALEKALNDYNAGTIDATELKMWRLISDFTENPDSSFSLKSIKQKAIDLMYLSQHWAYSESTSGEFPYSKLNNDMMVDILINFTDGDLQKLTLPEPERPEPLEPFTEERPTMELTMPEPPIMPEYTDKIYDKPLAQWYTNLWYAMDGNSKSDEIYSIYDEQANFAYFTVPNQPKTSSELNHFYITIDDVNAGNSDWLQFGIENGLMTIAQAGLVNNLNGNEIYWNKIGLSSTSDIYETEDETKIAKAETEYKKTLLSIQAEDKNFDIEIKKLDAEHSALKQEIESIKQVMTKNIEKSFNSFS